MIFAFLFLGLGGVITAFATSFIYEASQPEYMGDYYEPNKEIQEYWAILPQCIKNFHILHPNVTNEHLPFGIDPATNMPKGYPSCLEGEYESDYEATLPLPDWCSDEESGDDKEGNCHKDKKKKCTKDSNDEEGEDED